MLVCGGGLGPVRPPGLHDADQWQRAPCAVPHPVLHPCTAHLYHAGSVTGVGVEVTFDESQGSASELVVGVAP